MFYIAKIYRFFLTNKYLNGNLLRYDSVTYYQTELEIMSKALNALKLTAISLIALSAFASEASFAKTITFGGYVWTVRPNGTGNPYNNNWSENNVFLDAQGRLHLKLTYSAGKWFSSELYTNNRLGFGTYQFQLDTRTDTLDKNVILGLFSYPTPDVGPDTTHEIDIEFAKWGVASNNMINYGAWPVVQSLGPSGTTFPLALNGDWSTHRYIRKSNNIRFQSTHGHYDTNLYPIADWTYAPTDYLNRISQSPQPLHINLWSIAPPSNGAQVEVIISQFKFTPL